MHITNIFLSEAKLMNNLVIMVCCKESEFIKVRKTE